MVFGSTEGEMRQQEHFDRTQRIQVVRGVIQERDV